MTTETIPERQKPTPGSIEALAQGCLCPVVENWFGQVPPYGTDRWWVMPGCPVHAPAVPRIRRIETARQEAGTS